MRVGVPEAAPMAFTLPLSFARDGDATPMGDSFAARKAAFGAEPAPGRPGRDSASLGPSATAATGHAGDATSRGQAGAGVPSSSPRARAWAVRARAAPSEGRITSARRRPTPN